MPVAQSIEYPVYHLPICSSLITVFMRRVTSIELLDEDQGQPKEIQTSFDDLWRINRWLGGISGSLRLLNLFFRQTASCDGLRILDVGAGDGRMTNYLDRTLRRRCPGILTVALDRRSSHLRNRWPWESPVWRVVADVTHLPFRPDSFDVVTCNLFLHHFSGTAATELLQTLLSTARDAVLINDLERNWVAHWIIRHAPWIARSPMTRADGPASVRQAYTRRELRALAGKSGAAGVEVMRLPFFRVGVILWKRNLGAAV